MSARSSQSRPFATAVMLDDGIAGRLRHIRGSNHHARPHTAAGDVQRAKGPTMWILTEAPRGSNFYEAESTCGNKALISDTCDTVLYARSQGADGFRIVAQRGRETFFVGSAPVRGTTADINGQMLDIARQLNAVVLT